MSGDNEMIRPIEIGPQKSNALAEALLARTMRSQASSPFEAFSNIATAYMAGRQIENNSNYNNSRLAHGLNRENGAMTMQPNEGWQVVDGLRIRRK
ncbi:hypothetical protein FPY71_11560 [Aureimonas fodinaquatilis]|uniref:Uncharacterized protein n=1 Tax=Aureimonas fodinaquatilis TaxID=2565783 RepID=A0A5B0DYZ2_9HYPH|nr:hypothetical protein [Aureimonas fodinaquatilis]KAA0971075.1 hypothetical protein FPY71_11560 [Aureimonas fodinaquatilis]